MGHRSRVRPPPFDIVTFYDSQLRAVVAHTPRPMFYLVHRGSGPGTLDSALLAQSREAGDEVRFGVHRREAGPGTIVATGPDRADGLAAGLRSTPHCPTRRTPSSTLSWHPAATPTS